MPNYVLTLSYDGTRYKGWQRQGNTDNTIETKVEAALTRILGQSVELAASGRTDAGVHARAQVCSFHARTDMDSKAILAALRSALPEDIGAMELREAAPRFHARPRRAFTRGSTAGRKPMSTACGTEKSPMCSSGAMCTPCPRRWM